MPEWIMFILWEKGFFLFLQNLQRYIIFQSDFWIKHLNKEYFGERDFYWNSSALHQHNLFQSFVFFYRITHSSDSTLSFCLTVRNECKGDSHQSQPMRDQCWAPPPTRSANQIDSSSGILSTAKLNIDSPSNASSKNKEIQTLIS